MVAKEVYNLKDPTSGTSPSREIALLSDWNCVTTIRHTHRAGVVVVPLKPK